MASTREQCLTYSYLTKAQSVTLHPTRHEKQEKREKKSLLKAVADPKGTERQVVSAGGEGHILVVKCCNRSGSVTLEYQETSFSANGPL